MDELDFISVEMIEMVIDKVKETGATKVPMSFVVSLFPNAYNNLREQLAQEYMRGYNDGKNSLAEDDGK